MPALSLHMRTILQMAIVLLACGLAGCVTGDACYTSATPAESLRSLYVVKRGWHTGLAIAASDWPNRQWSVLADFSDADYLEFGWGEARFYQAEQETWWMALRAALWPNPSVIHVIGVRQPFDAHLYADDIVEVRVSAEGLQRLAAAIEGEFTDANPVPTGVSVSYAPQPNRFYRAKRKFFFPRMCNWWTATLLEEAACPIKPWTVVSGGRVMREARAFGEGAHR